MNNRLFGMTTSGLIQSARFGCWLDPHAEMALHALADEASQQGFDLRVASGFRDFERQRGIWNRKATGAQAVLDSDGTPLDIATLSEEELMFAILRWSALPGASRHHWGSDMDVYDAAAISDNYALQLTVAECCGDGPFTAFHQWLDKALPRTEFYRPYAVDRGGIAQEPWHLSFRPVSDPLEEHLTVDALRRHLDSQDIALKRSVLAHLDSIYERFIRVADSAY